jgi:UDP-glucose 4-epimerase
MISETILITGGAGYIGSHAVLAFETAGYPVVVLDDLSTGRRGAVPGHVPFYEGDAGNSDLVRTIIGDHGVSAVVHFAGSVVVPESVANPLKYYLNNTCVSRNLIGTCADTGVRHFIFSSTAAVYGIPEHIPVAEDTPTAPINPYGTSKLMTEWILRDCAAAHDFNYAALRYFNVAGADPEGRAGQSTPDATHLIKVACQTALGSREYLEIYGEDYDTPDGTCIRDYIHVSDLAEAHVKALERLRAEDDNLVLNCGYGHGFSVREVLSAVEAEAGHSLPIRSAPRRAGDPPQLIADNGQICARLGWRPSHDNLGVMVRTALEWERALQGKP